jgi:cytoskeletal protein RodZ
VPDPERNSSKHPPWHQEQDLEQVSFGTWLERQRVTRGIELREIADHTKIGMRYLEALEKDRFDLLPAPVFTKGFLKQYGRYLGLDPDQVVNTYLNALQDGDPGKLEEPSTARTEGVRRGLVALVLAGVVGLLGLAAYLAFWRGREAATREPERPPIAAPTAPQTVPVPEETLELPEEAPAMAPLVVTLDFVDDSWLETVVDGERQLSEQVGKGESRRILAQETVALTLGNAPGVRAEVNGTPYPLPPGGQSGVLHIQIDLATASEIASGDSP